MLPFDLLIPTAGQRSRLSPLLESLHHQTSRPERVVILCWKALSISDRKMLVYHLDTWSSTYGGVYELLDATNSSHQPGSGVGYDRGFLVDQATAAYSCLIDEDNVLPDGHLDAWISGYDTIRQELGEELIVSPTIKREGMIQSQGITNFRYRFPKYTYGRCVDSRQVVRMIGANSLLGRTELFQHLQFDSRFVGSYEDIDFTSRASASGVSIVVMRDVWIDHQESPKTTLQSMFLGTPQSAYYRSRNRILRVRKTATLGQKIQYFACGLRVQTAGRYLYLLFFPAPQKWLIGKQLIKGIRDGLTMHGIGSSTRQ